MLCLFWVYLETNSLIQRTEWKPVSLTVLRACTNQVDDVLVPSNILHRVHFRQEVSQLVLSSIGWKIRQIIDYVTFLPLPPVLQDSWEIRFYVKVLLSHIMAFIKLLFRYCSTLLVRCSIHHSVNLCGTELSGYPVPNGGGNSENNWSKLRFIFLISRQHGVTGIKKWKG